MFTNLAILLTSLIGLWLLYVLKQRNKSRKPAIISLVVLIVLRGLYYILLNIAGDTSVVILINLISLASTLLILYVFAMSLALLIIFKK